MYKIIKNERIAEGIYLLEVIAPLVVNKCLPGQFVILMPTEDSEKIPLTIYDYNRDTGVLSMVYQVVGATSLKLSKRKDYVYSCVGPLGNPSEIIGNIEKLKGEKILLVGGGVGIAPIYPQAAYFYSHGLTVDIIYGSKTKDTIILEEKIRKVCRHLYIMTDDGTYGEAGFVTDGIKKLQDKYAYCVAIGPLIMMKNVANITKEMGIKTIVSMNPIMVDGTGMCGACRLLVNGEIKFACVDGPEFDGHQVDFDAAMQRMKIYKTEEGRLYLAEKEGESHHGGCGNCGD